MLMVNANVIVHDTLNMRCIFDCKEIWDFWTGVLLPSWIQYTQYYLVVLSKKTYKWNHIWLWPHLLNIAHYTVCALYKVQATDSTENGQ